MEEVTVSATAGSLPRVLAKAASIAVVAGLVALGFGGRVAAAGAGAGSLAAGAYAWSYLRSHLARAGRLSAFDPVLARQALLRLAVVVVVGAGAWLLGRQAAMAYLASFGVAFAVLVASEAPRVTRQLRGLGVGPAGRSG